MPEPGHPRGWNRYGYVYGNPVRYSDPSGHFGFEETPDDPVFWNRDKPNGLEAVGIRGNYLSFYNWEESRVTDYDMAVPFVALYGGPVVMVIGGTAVAEAPLTLFGYGMIGEVGYTGSVIAENCLNTNFTGCSLNGWNGEDGIASFLTSAATGPIQGGRTAVSFLKGAAQNGGAYAMGQWFKGDRINLGITALNSVSGGFAGRVGEILTSRISGQTSSAALARIGMPIITSAGAVATQNTLVQEVSHQIQSKLIQDPLGALGAYARYRRVFPRHP